MIFGELHYHEEKSVINSTQGKSEGCRSPIPTFGNIFDEIIGKLPKLIEKL